MSLPRLGWRWAVVAVRILAILAWFALIILPHLALSAAGRRDTVPPLFLAGVGWLAGLRVRAHGRPVGGRLLLVSNHVSWLDILALAGDARAAFVGKSSLTGQSFLHWLCVQNDTVFITRDRRGTVSQQIDQVVEGVARRRLVIFPEGTTGNGVALLPFKSALLAAADGQAFAVQPVALDYRDAAEIAWVGEEPGLRNVMRILARLRPVCLTIHYCAPLAGPQLADRKAITSAVQAAVSSALRL